MSSLALSPSGPRRLKSAVQWSEQDALEPWQCGALLANVLPQDTDHALDPDSVPGLK